MTTGGCNWVAFNTAFCNGLAVPCFQFPYAACGAQAGCTTTPAQCTGTPTPCEQLSVADCATQPGCRLSDGSNGGTGGTTSVSTELIRRPDLLVTYFTVTEVISSGKPAFTYTVREANRGLLLAKTHLNKVVASKDKTIGNADDVLLVDLTGALELRPGMLKSNEWSGSYYQNYFAESYLPSGEYYLGVSIDANREVLETEEENNLGMTATPLFLGTADYNVTPLSLTTTAGTSVPAEGSFDVTVTVKNLGNRTLKSLPVSVLLSPDTVVDATDRRFCTKTFDVNLAVAAQTDVTLTCSAPRLRQTLNLGVELNAAQTNFESDYSNNTLFGNPVTITAPSPDLTVKNVVMTESTVAYDGSVGISATIENAGVDPVASAPVTFYLSKDSVYDSTDYLACQSVGGTAIAAGASTNVALTCKLPGTFAGTYKAIATVDKSDAVFETSESNNTAVSTGSLVITPPEQDLAISGYTGLASSTIYIGQNIPFQFSMYNIKSSDIKTIKIAIYLSADKSYNSSDTEVCSKTVTNTSFDLETQYDFSCVLPELTVGSYYFIYVADPDQTILESNETNNWYPWNTTITVAKQ
jgi:subtilase family serine protease